ncbi:MAG: CotH kinase family protein [Treponema sp.]|nr:CotH kinase family protein [Treponema sp.]
MKKMNVSGFTAMVILLIGSLTLFNACPNEPKQKTKATQYSITVIQGEGGAIAASPLEAEAGEEITLTAAAGTGFRFDSFTVNTIDNPVALDSGSGGIRTFKMPAADVWVTASFIDDNNEPLLTIALIHPESGGTISTDKKKAETGETVTITAVPATGFKLDTITVNPEPENLTVAGNSATFTITANVTVSASFIVNTGPFTVSLTQPASGGTIDADKTEATAGETVTITAEPASSFELNSITVSPKPANLVITGNKATFTITANVTVTASFKLITSEIEFSHAPGVYEAAFNLTVSFPANPNAVIYYTLDGTEPVPGDPRTINSIVVSGSVVPGNTINIADRTSSGRSDTLLTRFYNVWMRNASAGPPSGAKILTGNAYRFRAFVDSNPASETVIATYLIIPNATSKYNNTPILSINAPFQPFYDLYAAADRWNPPDNSIGRQDFNYEYFTVESGSYKRQFSLPGSTSLGASFSRANAQRTFNVHLRRGSLNGTITWPIFEGSRPEGIYRFRLWNGGNNFVGPRDWSFGSDHFRDAFAQKSAAQLNVPYSESSLAIMFIDGEYWGFTQFRQQTDNAAFAEDRLGMTADNIVIMDRGALESGGHSDLVEEGNITTGMNLYNELLSFVNANFSGGGAPSNNAVEELFDTYFDKANFIDYHIVNTFYNNTDWPQNNVRFWRAITPKTDGNPNNDGKWRFTLHDIDYAANGIVWAFGNSDDTNYAGGSRFDKLKNPEITNGDRGPELNRMLRVFNNQGFVDEFTVRAKYVLEEYFTSAKTIPLYDAWLARFTPLLDDMYERWSINSGDSLAAGRTTTRNSFNKTTSNVKFFLNNRGPIYLGQLNDLRSSVGLGNLP